MLLLLLLLGQISLKLKTGKTQRYIICSDSFTPSGFCSAQMGHLLAGKIGRSLAGVILLSAIKSSPKKKKKKLEGDCMYISAERLPGEMLR